MKILIVSNMYPNEDRPFWGTFVKSCVDGYLQNSIDVNLAVLKQSSLRGYLRFYLNVLWMLATRKYTHVHVHYVTHSVPPVLLMRLVRKFKLVLNFHGSDAFPESSEGDIRRKIKCFISKIAVRSSTQIVVPSEYFKTSLEEVYLAKNVLVSPSGGVDSARFSFAPGGGDKVLFAGRMLAGKGAVIAAEATKACWEQLGAATFIGDGPDRARVEEILENLPVSYSGLVPHSELSRQMAMHDIFLFPSTRRGESLGLVLVESIFSGMVPVAMENGAVREIIPCELQEMLIAMCPESFAHKTQGLLRMSSAQRISICSRLYEHVREKFEQRNVAMRLINDLF